MSKLFSLISPSLLINLTKTNSNTMDPGWQRSMENHFNRTLSKVVLDLGDLEQGVKYYAKRKADGSTNYMCAKKSKEGDVDYIVKSGHTNINSIASFRLKSPNHSDTEDTQDSTSVCTKEAENKEEEVKSEDEGEKQEGLNNVLTQPIPRNVVNAPDISSSLSSSSHNKPKLCPDCFNPLNDVNGCHSRKYGRFCAFVSFISYNGGVNPKDYKEEKEKLAENYKLAYHTVCEWEKVKVVGLKPIDKEEFTEELPGCIVHFCKLWMESLQETFDRNKRIEAQYQPMGQHNLIKEETETADMLNGKPKRNQK